MATAPFAGPGAPGDATVPPTAIAGPAASFVGHAPAANPGTTVLAAVAWSVAPSRDAIPPLDGLRAASILLVLLGHFGLERVIPGTLGVTVFFAVSGFLITRQLLAEAAAGPVSVPRFYARRAVRLWPALLLMVPLASAAVLLAGGTVTAAQVLAGLFYATNYVALFESYRTGPGGMDSPLVVLWSLAVEEHFYIVFPFLVLALPRPARLAAGLAAVILVVTLWRHHLALACFGEGDACMGSTAVLRTTFATDARLDSIAYGALLAALLGTGIGPRLLRTLAHPVVPLAALGLLLMSLVVRDPVFRSSGRHLVQGVGLFLGLGWVLFAPGAGRARRVLSLAPVRTVGVLSYSLYLWHGVVLVLAVTVLPAPLWRDAIVAARPGALWLGMVLPVLLALSLLAAWASYSLVERPFLGLRHRLRGRA